MSDEICKQVLAEMEAIMADPKRKAEWERAMAKSMRAFGKWCKEQDEQQRESERRALAHYLRIKDIPFMGVSK